MVDKARYLDYQVGIDLGGTKTEVILLDQGKGEIFRERMATPQSDPDNYRAVIRNIKLLVDRARAHIPANAGFTIGMGIPGTLDRIRGRVLSANTTWLSGKPFQADLEKILGRPVAMDNDANCFTLAEALGGAGQGYTMVFGIIMGTGCGGGISINGKIHAGANGIAGEWGHLSIDPAGETCFCGNPGCIDTKLTGPALARAYQGLTGTCLAPEAIIQGYRAKDPQCTRVFEGFLDDFGRALGGLISLLDPDAVVMGGGLSNIPELYTKGVEQVKAHAFHPDVTTPILKNSLGDSAGVIGAAWLGASKDRF